MKLHLDTRVPVEYNRSRIEVLFRETQTAVNALAEEGISAFYQARTAAPTTGSWVQGDFVRNSAPSEAGSGGSKYVITGWICTQSGTPGTWLEARILTGN
jgi:hypothetical protein